MTALEKQVSGSHYKSLKIQPIEFIHANNIPFAEGSVIKYVTRWRDKGGIADLEKAKHFLELLIELEQARAPE
jgi:UDP-3-O-acyl-N-acetylglucosamine deacetylase